MLRKESAFSSLLLLIVDVFGLYLSVSIFKFIRLGYWEVDASLPFFMIMALMVFTFYISNLYGLNRDTRLVSTFSRIALATLLSSIVASSLIYMTRTFEFDTLLWRSVFVFAMFGFFCWATFVRYVLIRYLRNSRVADWYVIGDQNALDTILDAIPLVQNSMSLQLVSESDYINNTEITTNVLDNSELGGIVIARDRAFDISLSDKLLRDRLAGIKVWGVEDFIETYGAKVPVRYLQDNWFVMTNGFQIIHQSVALRIKRAFDVSISLVGLLLCSPIMLAAALLIKLGDRKHIFYSQERTGKGGVVFTMYKFRTMIVDAEANGARWADENDTRITKVGNWLRRTRIDELPQLWNVLLGSMSFVGPRPERPEF